MIIDCQDCEMYRSKHCEDCFVMAVLSHKPGAPLEIDPEQHVAIESLQQAGLAPALKFQRKAGGPGVISPEEGAIPSRVI